MKRILISLVIFLATNTYSQEPIFATIPGGDLYSFNLTNCTQRFVGSTGQGFGDIAFTTDGRLWGIVGGQLYRIDTTNANATLIGFTGVQAVSLVGLNDTTLLAEYGAKLYSINTTNASSNYIDSIGYSAAGDLTWYDNNLYIVSPLVKIVLNNSNDSILNVVPINLSLPTCEGAVTKTFSGDYNSIVGFNGTDAIKICQITGSYQMLCPNINPGGTPGAASIRLPIQNPLPTSCSMTSISTFSQLSKVSIYPNPSSDFLSLSLESSDLFTYSIYDSRGQLCLKGVVSFNTKINVTNLENGIYVIELRSSDKLNRNTFAVAK